MDLNATLSRAGALAALLTFLLAPPQANAAAGASSSDPTRNVAVWLNLVEPLIGVFRAGIDIKASAAASLGPTFAYYSSTSGTTRTTADGFGLRGNWYPKGAIKKGFRATLIANFITGTVSEGSFSAPLKSVGLTALAGYQWVYKSYNVGLGAGFSLYPIENTLELSNGGGGTESVAPPGVKGVRPAIEFSLGLSL